MQRAEFARLFVAALHEAARVAEAATGRALPRRFQIELHGAGHLGDPVDQEEAVRALYLGPDRFYRIVDVGVLANAPEAEAAGFARAWVRVSGHPPSSYNRTWNQPAGSGPFKVVGPVYRPPGPPDARTLEQRRADLDASIARYDAARRERGRPASGGRAGAIAFCCYGPRNSAITSIGPTRFSLNSSRSPAGIQYSRCTRAPAAWFRSARPRATISPGAARLRASYAEAETTSVARDLGATSETASKGARWLASSPHPTRGRYLGIRGPAEKEGPVRACVAALPRWSGWRYAQ